jgi:psp operon transcriptional activator
VRELKSAVERSLYRWNDPLNPVDAVVIDPFASPYDDARPTPTAVAAATATDTSTPLPFAEQMRQVEKTLVQRALREHDNNQRRTADALGLSYDQLRGLVRKHGLSQRKRRRT